MTNSRPFQFPLRRDRPARVSFDAVGYQVSNAHPVEDGLADLAVEVFDRLRSSNRREFAAAVRPPDRVDL